MRTIILTDVGKIDKRTRFFLENFFSSSSRLVRRSSLQIWWYLIEVFSRLFDDLKSIFLLQKELKFIRQSCLILERLCFKISRVIRIIIIVFPTSSASIYIVLREKLQNRAHYFSETLWTNWRETRESALILLFEELLSIAIYLLVNKNYSHKLRSLRTRLYIADSW